MHVMDAVYMYTCQMPIVHQAKSIDYTTIRVSPNGIYGLELIIIYQYWPINCNRCTTLTQDANNRRHCALGAVVQGCTGTLCTSCPIFRKPTTALKNKVYYLKQIHCLNLIK